MLTVSSATTEIEFLERLFKRVSAIEAARSQVRKLLESDLAQWVKRFVPKKMSGYGLSFEFDHATGGGAWQQLGLALVESLSRLPGRWLFMIDELPIFIMELLRQDDTASRARNFLNWFREIRQGWDGADNFRWILAGSVGLDTIAARYNMGDTINDLFLIGLGPFGADTADRFLRALARSYDLDFPSEARARVVERLEWSSPYFLQLIFSRLRDYAAQSRSTITSARVDEAFESLLQPSAATYFDYWRQRLNKQLERPQALWARDLLSTVAHSDAGVPQSLLLERPGRYIQDHEVREEELSFLLRMLEMDGYLTRLGGVYRFRSPLLRAYWLRCEDA